MAHGCTIGTHQLCHVAHGHEFAAFMGEHHAGKEMVAVSAVSLDFVERNIHHPHDGLDDLQHPHDLFTAANGVDMVECLDGHKVCVAENILIPDSLAIAYSTLAPRDNSQPGNKWMASQSHNMAVSAFMCSFHDADDDKPFFNGLATSIPNVFHNVSAAAKSARASSRFRPVIAPDM